MRISRYWRGCLILLILAMLTGLIFPDTAQAAGSHDEYRELVVGIEDEGPSQQIQLYRVDSSGNKITGICNVCSITTLLNRRLVYDGKTNEEFTVFDVFDACDVTVKKGPCTWNGKGKTGFVYNGDTGYWSRLKYKDDCGTVYQAVRLDVDDVKAGVKEAGNFNNYLIRLLHEHPEGICIRNEAANHVAVIYYYEIVNGRAQFYVKDPVERYSGKLEKAWIYNARNVHSLYSGLDFIVYLEGSVPAPEPDENCRTISSLSEGSSGRDVLWMQIMLKTVLGIEMEADGYFGSGTEKVLQRFQRSVRLDDDGICGSDTWERLLEQYEKITAFDSVVPGPNNGAWNSAAG